ncbi:hypothetical protein [Vibrio aquimaris]|uniref:Uncharacterized protein n=1 Tax=Vibrio aquimaris TaxID=2587862 RepID=A0A5P9CJG0_9VIBR|nr:hypothetical protein [Vibrio aquimaris]QFT25702.1 hypothetical protein FIV01_04600 [Vibrio aquimaris]
MAKNNHNIDEAEFGLSVGISHLMTEKGELFYANESRDSKSRQNFMSSSWQKIKHYLTFNQ